MNAEHLSSFGITSNFTSSSILLTDSENKLRVRLFGTDKKINSVACELLDGDSTWQKIKECFGNVMRHTITLENGKNITILLNTRSLAKRLGIEKKGFKVRLAAFQILDKHFKENGKAFQEAMLKISTLKDKEILDFNSKGLLGEGSFGLVHQVCLKVGDLKLPEFKAALKTPRGYRKHEFSRQEGARNDLENEHRMLQHLNPRGEAVGIQKPHHQVSYKGETALLMTRYDSDLRRYTKLDKLDLNLDKKHFKTMIIQLLTGLVTIHKKGLFHGDIKPENILVKDLSTKSPLFHIADFGGVKDAKRLREDFNEAQALIKDNSEHIGKAFSKARGTLSLLYDPNFITEHGKEPEIKNDSPIVIALQKSTFEKGGLTSLQNADLFAIASTIIEVCKNQPENYRPILQAMLKGETTAEEALKAFKQL